MQGVGLGEVLPLQHCACAEDAEAVGHLAVLNERGGDEDRQTVGEGALHPRQGTVAEVDGERVGGEAGLCVRGDVGGEVAAAQQPGGVAAQDVGVGGVGPLQAANRAQLRDRVRAGERRGDDGRGRGTRTFRLGTATTTSTPARLRPWMMVPACRASAPAVSVCRSSKASRPVRGTASAPASAASACAVRRCCTAMMASSSRLTAGELPLASAARTPRGATVSGSMGPVCRGGVNGIRSTASDAGRFHTI